MCTYVYVFIECFDLKETFKCNLIIPCYCGQRYLPLEHVAESPIQSGFEQSW